MLKFISLQTNEGAFEDPDGTPYEETRRKVTIAYTDKRADVCNLLGNLPHQTEFTRDDLIAFARDVLTAFAPDDLLERVARNSERSRAIANGGKHDNG